MQLTRAQEAGYTAKLHLASEAPLETRWIVSRLSAVSGEVARALTDYRFDEAANAVYQFFWGEFCDWYIELVKLRLDFSIAKNETTAASLDALVTVFEAALRLLSPFMPFLTEELWHALYAQLGQPSPAASIALSRYPQASDFADDSGSVQAMELLQQLIVTVRALRKDLSVPEKEAAPIQLRASPELSAMVQANSEMLSRLARVSSVELVAQPSHGNGSRATASFDVAVRYERQIDVAAERDRLTKDLAKFTKGLEAAEKQLSSESFLAKAPAHIVDGLKKQAAETRALKEKAEASLAALPEA
jgi:valyl-tRNA synthetase